MKDEKTGATKEVIADTDDGVRPETTFESLSKLNAAFQKGGTTTAGNASQVTDGGAAILAMKRSTAQKLNLPVMGVFRTFAVAGCPVSCIRIFRSSMRAIAATVVGRDTNLLVRALAFSSLM